LELTLAKEHSAVDWSIRPLKPEWITYAALDVDILLDIRNAVEDLLTEQKKLKWAQQDFTSILKSYKDYKFSDQPKAERWRRTSGMHKVRDRLTMTIVRDLWLARDEIARQIDLAPGRVLGDLAIIELATIRPDNLEAVAKVISWRTKLESPPFNTWLKVLTDSLKTPLDQQPEFRVASENLPPMKIWKEKNPLGYARLTHARAALIELSKQIQIPTENLVTPELVKKICWQQPPSSSSEYENFVLTQLTQMGARPWQIEQVSPVIAAKLDAIEPVVVVEPPAAESEAEASA
jgi:ribonuclease D